jgi:dipeptidyl aminopeptidase/acylaminoacyl peptidase
MPNDKFMRAVYGTYDQFPERRKKDNPLLETPRLRTAVYLAHGTRDPVVPFEQSKLFYDKLSRLGRVRALHFSRPKVGHTYKFWAGQLPDVFSFFGRYRR